MFDLREKYDFKTSVSMLEEYSDIAQESFLYYLYTFFSGGRQITILVSEASELIDASVFSEIELNIFEALRYFKVNEWKNWLKDNNVEYDKKLKKDDLRLWIVKNCSDVVRKYLNEYITVTLLYPFDGCRKQLYTYFRRKYQPDTYYDENVVLTYSYPDDEITQLLVSKGFLKEPFYIQEDVRISIKL